LKNYGISPALSMRLRTRNINKNNTFKAV